jgi:hypothetical protein
MTAMRASSQILIAKILALAWGAWWTVFGLASGIGEGLNALGVFMHTVAPGGICLAIAVLAAMRIRIGAWLVVGAGAVFAIGYPIMARPQFGWDIILIMECTLAAPPIIAGALLLCAPRGSRA